MPDPEQLNRLGAALRCALYVLSQSDTLRGSVGTRSSGRSMVQGVSISEKRLSRMDAAEELETLMVQRPRLSRRAAR